MAASKEHDDRRQATERFIMLLGDLMEKMIEVDSKPMDFDTGTALTRAEIHTVQAIGRKRAMNLTRLAKEMGVTKGAASQMVTRLVRKDLVLKSPSAENRREIVLDLTDLGWKGYHAHERLHEQMLAAAHKYYGADLEARVAEGTRVVRDLIGLVSTYERRQQG